MNFDNILLSVDRWENYAKQLIGRSWKGSHVPSHWWMMNCSDAWPSITPKQYRRFKKKCRKNNDYSTEI